MISYRNIKAHPNTMIIDKNIREGNVRRHFLNHEFQTSPTPRVVNYFNQHIKMKVINFIPLDGVSCSLDTKFYFSEHILKTKGTL